jgi:hypothetical protein
LSVENVNPNEPMPHDFPERFDADSSDSHRQLSLHYPQDQTERFWKKSK